MMDKFALIDALRSYCNDNDYYFIYGNDAYANAQTDGIINKYQYILIADFTCQVDMATSIVEEIRYNGVLSFGENAGYLLNGSNTTLDETPEQKYDLRLKTLTTMLMELIGDISCENELEVSGINLRYDINKFDLNADFVACTLTLTQ
jgi:hypothetical protein